MGALGKDLSGIGNSITVDSQVNMGIDSGGLGEKGGLSADEAAEMYANPTQNDGQVPQEAIMENGSVFTNGWQRMATTNKKKFSPKPKAPIKARSESADGIKVLTMLIGPQEYRQDEPNRSTITQTIGGAWIDDFGLGLKEITIDFVSGFRKRIIPPTDNIKSLSDKFGSFNSDKESAMTDGFQNFKSFRNDIYRAYFNRKAGELKGDKPEYEMRLMVWENGDYYVVHPMEFSFSQSVTNPLMYRFTARFVVVRDLTEKEYEDSVTRVDRDPLAGALTDPIKRSVLFEVEAIRQLVNLTWQTVTLNNPGVEEAKEKAKALWEANYPDIPFDDVKPQFVVKAQEYRLWKAANNTPLEANYGSKVGWARIVKDRYRPLTPFELNDMKTDTVKDRVGKLAGKIDTIRQSSKNFNRDLANNFEMTTQDLRNTLLDIQKLEDGLLQLPRDLLPFPLIGSIRDMTCLVRSVMSFPELMKDSTNKAIADFRAAIKNSGCANTISPVR